MTTQATTIEDSGGGFRTLVGTSAVTLALLIGAALWLVWPGGDAATAPAPGPVTAAREGTAPLGRPVEQYPEDQRANTAHEAAPAAPRDGMAELGGEQAAGAPRYVYLVGSEDAATAARQLATGADQVLVVETEKDTVQVRVGLGRPGTTIVDLRTPGGRASASVPNPAALADQEPGPYARWWQAQAASGPEAVSHPDGS